MNPELLHEVRREQTRHELMQLSESITAWLERRRAGDQDAQSQYVGRHRTQLEAIESVLLGALQNLGDGLQAMGMSATRDTGEVYDECRDFDQAIVWVRRLWEYFKDKFDQRDDHARLGPLLKAADEVAWSCYRQVFVRAVKREPGLKAGPSPLPFIAPLYSPAAIESDKPLPSELSLQADLPQLDEFLQNLPMPVLRLPPWCVDAPWWLVYVAHEVGHHVLHDLKLIAFFRTGLETVAQARHLPGVDVKRWGSWGEEIFADLFSVMMMGRWAVWAMAEIERSIPAEMAKPKDRYPAPVVRLALLARAADRLGMNGAAALRGLPLAEWAKAGPNTERDYGLVDVVLDFALGPMRDKLGDLKTLCGVDDVLAAFGPGGAVDGWAKNLRTDDPPVPQQPTLDTARLVTSGALCAWEAITGLEDAAAREAERDRLRRNTLMVLRQSGPPGVRAALMPSGEQPSKGAELAKILLRASRARRVPEAA